MIHKAVAEVTERIITRSEATRLAYLERIRVARLAESDRLNLGCANLAHGVAACDAEHKTAFVEAGAPNIAIVTSYNDMLSAHQPFATYPKMLRRAVLEGGGIAQVAGGVPAMCDGITQGRAGMELSLFSRDVIAMGTAVALAHDLFDGVLLLGVCDKIVPGLLIGALAFGHLPAVLVPAGPMPSGLSNGEKSRVRQWHAEGKAGRRELLEAEMAAYHSPGTCTFYGTANSNQLLVEVMGLQLPGSGFVNPGTDLRRALTEEAGRRLVPLTSSRSGSTSLGQMVDERTLTNAMVALLATGGSTNHTMHLLAIAAAAGIQLEWDDFASLSPHVPLLARIYPNGSKDVNDFHAAGGTAMLVRELLSAGLLHADVETVMGPGLEHYTKRPDFTDDGTMAWSESVDGGDPEVLRPISAPFAPEGGLTILNGSLGRAVIKVSSVAPEHRTITAPARVFEDQQGLLAAYEAGELTDLDFVAVVRNQGPRANGMPELHKLTPALGALLDRGRKVALVTDGRMSGASGRIPAAIHCTPEAAVGGPLSRLRNGDVVTLDCDSGVLDVVDIDLQGRQPSSTPSVSEATGRVLFDNLRMVVGPPDQGASVCGSPLSRRGVGA